IVRLPFGLSDLSVNVRQQTFAVDGPFGSFFGVQVTSYPGHGPYGGACHGTLGFAFEGRPGRLWTSSSGLGGTSTSRSGTAMIAPPASERSSPFTPPFWDRRWADPASTRTRRKPPPSRTCCASPGG